MTAVAQKAHLQDLMQRRMKIIFTLFGKMKKWTYISGRPMMAVLRSRSPEYISKFRSLNLDREYMEQMPMRFGWFYHGNKDIYMQRVA